MSGAIGAAGSSGSAPNQGAAPTWAFPGGNVANTRDVASAINSANVSTLGVAWTVPIPALTRYTATPVVANGVVYTQDMNSDVLAIDLATGKILWQHNYNSPDGGPNGVNVSNGIVYAATATAAVALSATSGKQLWSRTLVHNDHEEIDMAPGYNNGTVYVSTAPVSTQNEYVGGGKAIFWALNAATGAPDWSWDEVENLWGNPGVNSGGGLWYAPSFDSQGNIYLGVANPGPLGGAPGYPWGTSRPGPNLYTDSVVKLSPAGKLLWYYQLTPHDLFDWDLQDPPVLTTANHRQVVISGGKAGILIELDAQTGKLIWRLPVGVHNGHDHDGVLTEHAKPSSHIKLPAAFCLSPGPFGGVETPLASNGTLAFAAVVNMPMDMTPTGYAAPGGAPGFEAAVFSATGELVAANQDTGKLVWAAKLPSAPYGAATVTNDLVFTTTLSGYLYAFNAATGAVLSRVRLPAGSNAPIAVDGSYVIVSAAVTRSSTAQGRIIAYRLGAPGNPASTSGG